ncbi:MAG: ferredoxin [Rhodospirillaceae bacterium BRH_c57]|nr:MAG: ferredoxin [Rhodospirillaceae bacterium BRH_c57]
METGKIVVTDRSGDRHELDAVQGWRVMELIRDQANDNADLKVEALCGGAAACATCHIYVDDAWADRLHPPRDEEVQMLDEAFGVTDRSRLSCQIIWSPDLDGLHVTLAPEFD